MVPLTQASLEEAIKNEISIKNSAEQIAKGKCSQCMMSLNKESTLLRLYKLLT